VKLRLLTSDEPKTIIHKKKIRKLLTKEMNGSLNYSQTWDVWQRKKKERFLLSGGKLIKNIKSGRSECVGGEETGGDYGQKFKEEVSPK